MAAVARPAAVETCSRRARPYRRVRRKPRFPRPAQSKPTRRIFTGRNGKSSAGHANEAEANRPDAVPRNVAGTFGSVRRGNRKSCTMQGILAHFFGVAQSRIAMHNRSDHYVGMSSYRHSEESECRIVRCAACEGTVLAEIGVFGRIDANTACASCGMTLVDSPFSGGDYYDVIMRVGRPVWHGLRPRRAG